MPTTTAPEPPLPAPAAQASRRSIVLAVALIVLAVIAAYANSLRGPFVFDDLESIPENNTLRSFATALLPPGAGRTVSGRPVLNLSFALNRATGGLDPRGYHVTNLLIHLAAALTVFGLARRTLLLPRWRGRFATHASPLASVIALLWALHPVQTEGVTYVVQRAESLASLFYLLTLYAAFRAAHVEPGTPLDARNGARRSWPWLAWLACLLGVATKEIVASAPLLVVLFDRAFIFPSFAEAWRERKGFYLALADTWVPLALLVAGTHGRGMTAGYHTDVTWASYALTQLDAFALYVGRALWPAPLVFDYGNAVVSGVGALVFPAFFVAAVLVATALAWRRSPAIAFPAVLALAVLAPTTSVVPIATQTIAEHRMYLPLIAVTTLGALALHALLGRRTLLIGGALALAFVALTARRNLDYRTPIGLWQDTAAKHPNARAEFNLGLLLAQSGRLTDALPHYRAAVRLQPDYFEAQTNLGAALLRTGAVADALAPLSAATRLRPTFAEPHGNLGNALLQTGRFGEAMAEYEAALRLAPKLPELHAGLARALAGLGRPGDAATELTEAVRLAPDQPDFRTALAIALCQAGRAPEALPQFEAVARARPDDPAAQENLGNGLLQLGRTDEALARFRTAARLAPGSFPAAYNLGNALVATGRTHEAVDAFGAALRLQPDSVDAHVNRAAALAQLGRTAEALEDYEAAARLEPGTPQIRQAIERLRAALGRAPSQP